MSLAPAVPTSTTSAATDCICELQGLGVRRGEGRWLVRGLNVRLARGRMVAVVGPSGAGKSSLLSVMTGALQPAEGRVLYCHGHEGASGSGCAGPSIPPGDFHQRMGIVFQNFLLSENLPVLTNVMCGRLGRHTWWRTFFGFPRADMNDAMRFLCEMELGRHAWSRVRDVSGGEQQRVAIARALCREPDIYLADEPVAHLDWPLARRVMARLRREATEHGRTVVAVMHDPALVEEFADDVLEMNRDDAAGWTWRPVKGARP
ncbi:hypothetical protein DB346_02165 [Verrucomicrobia bacterium LW23]|nr:hypothetical protein DB346_02165 [Verrucomicrobia bacterium LW23]